MMNRTVAIALCLIAPFLMSAQDPDADEQALSYFLPEAVSYDPAVPTPEAFFGFQVGQWHLQPDQIHAYIRELARASDRLTVRAMGRTYEDREIILAVITSPQNHARIDDIRAEHIALSDPARSARLDVSSMPAVLWMGYSVHGNEASGSNASVLVAYYLAAATGTEIEEALEKVVVLLNPSINPDGLNRFASWVNANKGMTSNSSSFSREHREPWPRGRSNHYWFDLNRDWMPLQHPESRARMDAYYEWRPNVLTDHHEMQSSSTFFFQPGIPSRNNPLVPASVYELTGRVAKYHAHALDSIGSLYYSGESFDDFYIGKGSSYPDITGGIGILFEQASSRGHLRKTAAGMLTFPFTIRNQVTTSLSTLRGVVNLRVQLLEHQREMAKSAITLAERSRIKAYVFGLGQDHGRTRALAEILDGHDIGVFHLAREVSAGGNVYRPGESFVVPVRQVQYRLLTSLFELRTDFEDSVFYDISAWSLPLAVGLPYAELRSIDDEAVGRAFGRSEPVTVAPMPDRSLFYAFTWNELYAPRALGRLFDAGIIARMAFEEFTAMTGQGARSFGSGTIVIATGGQPVPHDRIREVLQTILKDDHIEIHGVISAKTERGIDLGSPSMRLLEPPRIALVAGEGVSATDAGEIWHLLDERYKMTVTLLDPDLLRQDILDDWNVLVVPSGNFGEIAQSRIDEISRWIQKGNTLIALEQAAVWAISKKLARVSLKEDASRGRDTVLTITYGEESALEGARRVPGAIVSATADLTHPLVFGWTSPDVHLFKSTPYAFMASPRKAITPVTYAPRPLVSGYLHDMSIDHIKGGAAMAVASSGHGKVVLFADNQTFRAFWMGTSRALSNAIFLAPSMHVPQSDE